jgi:hypothetical protein
MSVFELPTTTMRGFFMAQSGSSTLWLLATVSNR